MTQVQIVNRIQTDFGMVPRALWQMDLSANAKLCASYLFCLRDGSAPYVAQIERETGLGRDARRKAFAALEAHEIIFWVIERDNAGRVVAKSLVVDYAPLLSVRREPENQAHGNHGPEKPADGSPVPIEAASRPCSDGKSGDPFRKEKKQTRRCAARPDRRPAATGAKPQDGESHALKRRAFGALADVPSRLVGSRREFCGPDGQWHVRPNDPEDAKLFEAWCLQGTVALDRRAS